MRNSTYTQKHTYVSDEVLQGGMGDGDPIMGARAPAQLIQDDQWPLGRVGNDLGGFGQLLHERTAPFEDVVWGPHPDDQSDKRRLKVITLFFVFQDD